MTGDEKGTGNRPASSVEVIAPARDLPFARLVRERRSVRSYRPDPVPRDLIEQVVEAAGWAPSPHGRQPWRFVVLTQPSLKAQLAEAMGSEWLRQLSLDGDPPDVVAKRLARSHDRVRSAPVCIVVCLFLDDLDVYPDVDRQAAEETMAVQSLGAAAQNLLLAAYDVGLDGGWLCAPLFCQETVRQALSLPPTLHPHALLTLGYAAQEPKRRPRLPVNTLIYRYD
ncbi:MAG TPA: nitroreductase family protein [Chloroflexota bacterium]|nr:nitroreductase family protein [Chloroflexota bacterium]